MDLYTAITRAEALGIKTPRQAYAEKVDKLLEKTGGMSYPLVAKLVSEKGLHKTDVGGLILGIKSPSELVEAYNTIKQNARKDFKGVLVQEHVEGTEVIIGGKTDPQFGPVILFGLGGIFTEIFQDYSLRITPITPEKARGMIKEIKAYKILEGYRGKKGVNLKKLEETIVQASRIMDDPQVKEFDLNPVICTEKECIAVDARIIKYS